MVKYLEVTTAHAACLAQLNSDSLVVSQVRYGLRSRGTCYGSLLWRGAEGAVHDEALEAGQRYVARYFMHHKLKQSTLQLKHNI